MSNATITSLEVQQLAVHGGSLSWKRPARTTSKRHAMNRLESDYSAHLEIRKRLGEVTEYYFEGITLRMGDDCRYTPDFLVQLADGTLELHDVKGSRKMRAKSGGRYVKPYVEDDALVKLRTAARWFPFRVVAVYVDGGEWVEVEM